jgi:V8-like Glu-specific endopeptidase
MRRAMGAPSTFSLVFATGLLIVLASVGWAVSPYDANHPVESLGSRPISGMESIRALGLSSKFRVAASSVGQISLELPSHDIMQVCSGSIIAPNLVLTARHCFEYEDKGSKTIEQLHPISVYFMLDVLEPYAGVTYHLDVRPVDVGTGDLDFVVLKSKESFEIDKRRIPPAGTDPQPSEDLYVVHYPFGQTLTLTRFECSATDTPIEGDYFRHLCATQSSSSGAPVFDTDFRLKGIHVRGGKNENPGTFNLGISISKVLAASPIVAASLKEFGHDLGQSIVAPPKTVSTLAFRLEDGRTFLQGADNWTLSTEQDPKPIQLKLQVSKSDEYFLWDAGNDYLYRIPKQGGMVKGRQGRELLWSDIGRAQKI